MAIAKASESSIKLRKKTDQCLHLHFHLISLAFSAVYRINVSNSISNILLRDSEKKGEVLIGVFIASSHGLCTS